MIIYIYIYILLKNNQYNLEKKTFKMIKWRDWIKKICNLGNKGRANPSQPPNKLLILYDWDNLLGDKLFKKINIK
jgi:hypothetical protein